MVYSFQVEKATIYVNKRKKTLADIKKETGCDVIINGGLFDMSYNDRPNLWLRVDGKTLNTDKYGYWCYGWNTNDIRMIHSNDIETVQNAICCCAMVKDSKPTQMFTDSATGGVRGRTAIGTLPDGKVVIYCSKDGTSDAITPEKLQNYCLSNGWKDAIMLDSGGSSQCITPEGKITSTRKVHNVLCFWIKKETTKPKTTEGEVELPVQIKTNLANNKNYGGKRSTNNIRYLVIHYTANDGDTDESNAKFFKNNVVEASAHYFVDDDSITQSVPDDYVAWHCGGKKYASCSTTGGGTYYNKCTNSNSISIEICDDVKNGTVYPSAKTISNALALAKMLMKKYNIPAANVIRHFDVTGKLCPAYWSGNATKNAKWKTEFWNNLGSTTTAVTPTKSSNEYMVKITASTLNVRKGAGTLYGVVTTVRKDEVYTIVEEKNGWGKLKSGVGWIKLSYTIKC